jgi:hypothetical protein
MGEPPLRGNSIFSHVTSTYLFEVVAPLAGGFICTGGPWIMGPTELIGEGLLQPLALAAIIIA